MDPPGLSPSGSAGSQVKITRVTIGDDGSIDGRTPPADPDAGLSQVEKDELVCRDSFMNYRLQKMLTRPSGPKACSKARLDTIAMGMPIPIS